MTLNPPPPQQNRTTNQAAPSTQINAMASKRKSTVPCMIPSKSKHAREEIVLGCLPELLPTIPEDSILSISGEQAGHFSHDSSSSSSRPEGGDRWHKGGTYRCPPCCFESRDLNFFLDHLHNCHADFRAQPSFYCLNCGVSVVQFEALALHNARAHPELMSGAVHGSLHVKKRDGGTAVEQSLFTDSGEDLRDSAGISLTKTPIARMMKAKGEHKKIVVSHTVEVRRIDAGKEAEPGPALTNVPELQNGALRVTAAPAAKPRTAHAVTSVPSQPFHQHTPSLYTSPSSDPGGNLPKVMIPLSSIPTYNVAMDTSSFLKTSFGKFPYPTKAELCYLTVVSDFPEEQIKLWFTAQRLKQGISWSPEEIEEAKRKMFNTVFQVATGGAAPQKQPAKQRHVATNHHHHHIVTHHRTIGAQPAAVPGYPAANVHHGNVIGRQTRVVGAQPGASVGQQVTRVSYAATAPPPPPKQPTPAAVRAAQALTKSAAPSLEADKSVGLGLDIPGSSSCVISTSNRSSSSSSSCSSSSSISSYFSSSSNGGENGTRKPANNGSPSNSVVSCSTLIGNDNCSSDGESKQSGNANDESKQSGNANDESKRNSNANDESKRNSNANSVPSVFEGFSSNKSKVIVNTSSNSPDQCPLTQAGDDKNNNYIPRKTNSGSVSGDYSSTSNNDSVHNLNHASNAQNDNTSTTVITKSSNSSAFVTEEVKYVKEFPVKGMSILQQLIKEEDEMDKAGPGLKVDPIKINLKRLQVNEPDPESAVSGKPDFPEKPATQPLFFAPWDKKTPRQVHLLRQAFTAASWPSSQQYEDLSLVTGLPKPEVVRWFSDSRYVHKNGQLQWLDGYQRPPAAEEREEVTGLKEAGDAPKDRKLAEQDPNKQPERGAGQLNAIQRAVWRDTQYTPLLGLAGSEKTAESGGALQDHWTDGAERQTEGSQASDRLRTELLEV